MESPKWYDTRTLDQFGSAVKRRMPALPRRAGAQLDPDAGPESDVADSSAAASTTADPAHLVTRPEHSPSAPAVAAGSDPIVNIYTLELGPFASLTDLHSELSNHEGTFAIAVWENGFEVVQSVSHSIVRLDDGLHVSVVTATLESPDQARMASTIA